MYQVEIFDTVKEVGLSVELFTASKEIAIQRANKIWQSLSINEKKTTAILVNEFCVGNYNGCVYEKLL